MTHTVYIGLGSNLGDCIKTLYTAVKDINQLPTVNITGLSRLYSSRPVGPQDQPGFYNMAAQIRTTMAPLTLLAALQAIENQHGRKRLRHWGPRALDLDILLYGTQKIDHADLTVPHPELANRTFVLQPLVDMQPSLTLPDGQVVQDLLAKFPQNQYPIAILPEPACFHDFRTTHLAAACTASQHL